MGKFIINSTALRNNGDVALVTALYDALVYRGHRVSVATPDYESNSKLPAHLVLCPDIKGTTTRIFRQPVARDIDSLYWLIFNAHVRKANVILGAPGGYINSYYGFAWKLTSFTWAKRLNLRTAIYAQSFGPLTSDDKRALRSSSRHFDAMMSRDPLSEETALAAGVDPGILHRSIDAIFLRQPEYSTASSLSKIVAISVREWHHDGRQFDHYARLIAEITNLLIEKGYKIDFLSTCQGIAGYIDDSLVAREIVRRLPSKHAKDFVTVIDKHLGLNELIERIKKYRLVVGTRLHMCLLSILSGVPALNISYEMKGEQCYRRLGLEEYTMDYNEPIDNAIKKTVNFIESENNLRQSIPDIISKNHQLAHRHLDDLLNYLGMD